MSPDKRDRRRARAKRGGNGSRPKPRTVNGNRKAAPSATQWATAFYKDASGYGPARHFLATECPDSVRISLLAILVAVRDAPPPAFPASNMWHAMHGKMKGFHEARDEHDGVLYRVFCVVDRNAPDHGLDAPTVALISGGVKAVGEAMDEGVYDEALVHRDDYRATRRIALPAGIPPAMMRKP